MVMEKTPESPLECKEIKPVNPKGNQSWILIRRTDAVAKAPILWPPYVKSWLIGKDADAGKDWRQEEKGTAEDGMTEWHHQLAGHEFEQSLGDGDGQGSLACCSPWRPKESDTNEQMNWTDGRRHSPSTPLLFDDTGTFYESNTDIQPLVGKKKSFSSVLSSWLGLQ